MFSIESPTQILYAVNLYAAHFWNLASEAAFFKKLRVSPLREVRILANVVGKYEGTVTARNLAYLKEVFKLDPWTQPMITLKEDVQGIHCARGGQLEAFPVGEAVEPTQGDGYM